MACPDHTKLDISCYTFGAPRTGNHAFAREYNEAVPDTWGIINDQVRASLNNVTAHRVARAQACKCQAAQGPPNHPVTKP
jgi:hypothetical protein